MLSRINPRNFSYAQLSNQLLYPTKLGTEVRTTCPFHDGSNPTALSVSLETGKFHCFACNTRGILLEWLYGSPPVIEIKYQPKPQTTVKPKERKQAEAPKENLVFLLEKAKSNIAGAKEYLSSRCIKIGTAIKYGLGYHPQWRFVQMRPEYSEILRPAILAPTGTPAGFANIYARSCTAERLHHIPSRSKGLFNFEALQSKETLILTEGVFDALSVIESGYPFAAALIGLGINNPEWYKNLKDVVLMLDEDEQGKKALPRIAKELKSSGVTRVWTIDLKREQSKDFNEFWCKNHAAVLDWSNLLRTAVKI